MQHSWTKLLETKFENVLNSRNCSNFQIAFSLIYGLLSMLYLVKFCWKSPKHSGTSQVLLKKTQNFVNMSRFLDKSLKLYKQHWLERKLSFFFWLKIDFLFCLHGFVQDCRLLLLFENSTQNWWLILKCMLVNCILKIQSIPSYKSNFYQLTIFSNSYLV